MAGKKIFINGLGSVSPQKTSGKKPFPFEPVSFSENQLRCADPGYREFIPADQIRRMGRIIKMGITASKLCLSDAMDIAGEANLTGNLVPDAIITGTGLGCLEDSEKFLATMIRNKEEFLTPTSFIQSTHNTVAGQIALLLKCHGYNFTFVHRGISFESALIDSMMQIRMLNATNVLCGGLDELTPAYFSITSRMRHWKKNPVDNLNLFDDHRSGSIAGEGASFFFLSGDHHKDSYAELKGVTTLFKPPSAASIGNALNLFLQTHGLAPADIDLVISGRNGDPGSDTVYNSVLKKDLGFTSIAGYKHLSGEYHTSSAFAVWLASQIIKNQTIPDYILQGTLPKNIFNILIYNHYLNLNHAFILITKV